MKGIILFGILLLSACTPKTTALPTMTPTEPLAFTLPPIETTKPFPTSTSISPSTLESISGGWSVFYSSEYEFSFQYPVVYDEGFEAKTAPGFVCNMQTGEDDDGNFNIWVGNTQIIVKKAEQKLSDFSDDYVKEMSINWNVFPTKQITVGGVPAITFRYTHKERVPWGVKTYLIHNKYLIFFEHYEPSLYISCAPPETGYSDYWVYEQIIKTWKFD